MGLQIVPYIHELTSIRLTGVPSNSMAPHTTRRTAPITVPQIMSHFVIIPTVASDDTEYVFQNYCRSNPFGSQLWSGYFISQSKTNGLVHWGFHLIDRERSECIYSKIENLNIEAEKNMLTFHFSCSILLF